MIKKLSTYSSDRIPYIYCMKVSIKLPKKLISKWKKELTNKTDCFNKTGVNRQTINKAIKSGQCTKLTRDKVNRYIVQERNKSNRSLKAVLK